MKLFRVTIKGGTSGTGTDYHNVYVVANDPTGAYEIYRAFLDKKDLCFSAAREMEKIELIADQDHYGDCGTLLFLSVLKDTPK